MKLFNLCVILFRFRCQKQIMMPRFNSDDFADANHLNKIGAEKFTKILMADIQKSYK